jgi:hypothetical protein
VGENKYVIVSRLQSSSSLVSSIVLSTVSSFSFTMLLHAEREGHFLRVAHWADH